ncbi:MAG: hypothetical protein M1497_15190 [Nitrospirae bacterium]|nr:hypothetical protein [Nitrospirota bacterium]
MTTKKKLTFVVMLLILMAFVYGCEGKSSYKVLSFFFDGVPPPGQAKSEAGREAKTEGTQPKTTYREHGPYAARQCEACHVRGSNRLVLPIEELCLKCHTLDLRKKYVHGPLASGGCKVCHEPHGSAYPYLLVAEPKEFCLYCHNRNDIAKQAAHKGVEAQCTSCHDAHSSDKKYLLL